MFKLWQTDKDGVSNLDKAIKVEQDRRRQRHDPNYEVEDLAVYRAGPPKGTEYLLSWYCELRGGENLTFTEIRNWAELKNISLEPYEVDALKQLDILYHKVSYEHFRATHSSGNK